jgi:hypothetical protein
MENPGHFSVEINTLAARSRLIELGMPELIARPEDYPAPVI